MDIEQKNKPAEKVPWFNYSTDKDAFYKRIQNFKQETEAMLQLPRKTEISMSNIGKKLFNYLTNFFCSKSILLVKSGMEEIISKNIISFNLLLVTKEFN